MTFTVVTTSEQPERIVGTIWADGETEAQQVATSVLQETGEKLPGHVVVRRSEEREIPLRFMN
jgi:hypothetical protein